jgi:hypothetical protein
MASIANDAQEIDMANQQKDTSRSDTTSPGGARPVQGQSGKVGSEVAGKVGGTDAAAGARMGGAGNQGGSGMPRQGDEGGAQGRQGQQGQQGQQLSPGAGAAVAGGTGLGEAASADDSRTGTSSGEGASLTGGDPSSGKVPPPGNKGGASAA